jgi:hypothetical protein
MFQPFYITIIEIKVTIYLSLNRFELNLLFIFDVRYS